MEALKNARLIVLAIAMILPATGALAAPHFEHHDANVDHEGGHYSDKGAQPTKAERLGVVLQSRALVDKAGTTELEVTTGKLDDSTKTPPGNIDKVGVELKLPASARHHGEGEEGRERQEFEKEFRHLRAGGYFHTLFTQLARGQSLAVQALVSGLGQKPAPVRDGEHRDGDHRDGDDEHERVKVELLDTVLYRPDLAVQRLDYAASARPNTAVTFSALMAERMGDVGAHVDCVLYVDGLQVDVANGNWVDAGTAVTCALAYTFPVEGRHTVKVTLENVRPGDYDPSNNSATGDILIQSPDNIHLYTASVSDATFQSDTTHDEYYSAASTVPDYHTDLKTSGWSQLRHFSSSVPVALKLPLKQVSYADSSDGVALNTYSFTGLYADSTNPSRNPQYTTESRIVRHDITSGAMLTIHRYENATTGAGITTLDVDWNGGLATYTSIAYCKTASGYPCVNGDFSINNTGNMVTGPWAKIGASYVAEVVLDDGTGTAYTAHPSMALTPNTYTNINPMSCYSSEFHAATMGKTCDALTSTTVSRDGRIRVAQ